MIESIASILILVVFQVNVNGSPSPNPVANTGVANIVCQANELACMKTCYDPLLKDCKKGIICNKNYELCGKSCYDTDGYSCIKGTLCPLNYGICGVKGTCYNKTSQICYENQYLCQNGQKLCSTICYWETEMVCLNQILCPANWVLCDTTCIDPRLKTCNPSHNSDGDDNDNEDKDEGLGGWAIFGIVVGSVLIFMCCLVGCKEIFVPSKK